MKNENNIDVRNEEIQEILGTPPGWILRFGTLIFLIVIVLLIWLSYWIQYPDVVESEIIVSFNDPPTKLISPKSGFLNELHTRHNPRVKKGQLLISYNSYLLFSISRPKYILYDMQPWYIYSLEHVNVLCI